MWSCGYEHLSGAMITFDWGYDHSTEEAKIIPKPGRPCSTWQILAMGIVCFCNENLGAIFHAWGHIWYLKAIFDDETS